MIDLRRLEILRELSRCGTIAATAEAVHLTPSAVSQQLAALSKEARTPMLEPDGRRVRLTAAAQLLLTHAHDVFTALEHADADLAAFRRGGAGTVRLGAFSSAIGAIVVPALSELQASTGLQVEVREIQPEQGVDALLARSVDVVITLSTQDLVLGEDDPRLAGHRVLDDVLDACLPAAHPLADRDEIRLADMAGDDWILSMPGVPCWHIAQAACQNSGFAPRVRHHVDEFGSLLALVGAGFGVGLIPRLARSFLREDGVVIRPLTGTPAVRHIGLQYRAGTANQPHIAPLLSALTGAAGRLSQRVLR